MELAEVNLPGLVGAINTYGRRLEKYVPLLREGLGHPALVVVATVAINDFNDLLFDSLAGRGRSALRSARSLFEHLLNLLALDDDDTRDRFMCHSVVGCEQVARWDPLEGFLEGKQVKAARHRRHKLRRDNRSQLAEVIEEYGSGFLRQWHPASLRDRAFRAGLEDEYEFFRASSAAVHGSASSMEGSFWVVDGEPVIRVGPSVITCPGALAAGTQFMLRFIRTLESRDAVKATLVPEIAAVGSHLTEFCKYTNGLEQYLFESDGLDRPAVEPQELVLRRERRAEHDPLG